MPQGHRVKRTGVNRCELCDRCHELKQVQQGAGSVGLASARGFGIYRQSARLFFAGSSSEIKQRPRACETRSIGTSQRIPTTPSQTAQVTSKSQNYFSIEWGKDMPTSIKGPGTGRPSLEPLQLSEHFPSLNDRPLSPRRVPVSQLEAQGLTRFVRLERADQQKPAQGLVPRSSKALTDFQKMGPQPSKYQTEMLKAAAAGPKDPRFVDLELDHMLDSSGSPFLSGTAAFTKGPNSQASHAEKELEREPSITVTISHTDRAGVSIHNREEKELLLPVGEHQRELAGTYTQHRNGESTYVDTSGDQPVTYTNQEADAKFAQQAGEQHKTR